MIRSIKIKDRKLIVRRNIELVTEKVKHDNLYKVVISSSMFDSMLKMKAKDIKKELAKEVQV